VRHEAEEQRRAVDGDDADARGEVDRVAAEDPARDQVGGEAEDEAAGADVVRVGRADEPRAEAADQRHDPRDRGGAGEAAEGDRPAEDEKRDRIADEMAPAGVQERREGDVRERVRIARVDAVGVEVEAGDVEHLDHPHDRDHRGHEDEAAYALLRAGTGPRRVDRGAHATTQATPSGSSQVKGRPGGRPFDNA
jgi:hypothetical protein